MKRRGRIILAVSVVAAGLLAAVGWHIYQKEFVGQVEFNAAFYAVAADGAAQETAFSYDDYAAALTAYVDDQGMVNYQKMKEDSKHLDDFLKAIARLNPKTYASWKEKANVAFWINAYNALTLKAIIDHYPIKAGGLSGLVYPANSIRQIPGVWDKLQFLVMSEKLTLEEIEHAILRGQDKKLVERYGKFYEPRIHMALVCAAMGCPRLRNEPFVGDRLDVQLDDQSRTFMANPKMFRIDRASGKVHLSSIFKWFGGDFVKGYPPAEGFSDHNKTQKAVLNFSAKYLPQEDAEYLRTGNYKIEYLDYDWSLNEQKP